MDLTSLKDRPVEWLRSGPASDVVVSSRVRLARNVDGFPFITRASDLQKARLEELLQNVLTSLVDCPPLTYVRLDKLGELLRDLLLERHLISAQHARADWVRAVAFDEAEQTSVMVNEEDHLRIQFIRGGLRLMEAFDAVNRLDDMLAERVPFAYSLKLGYLTACPTNVGTGMRASVMLHLPGIVMSQEMDRVSEVVQAGKLALRGLYGEGTYGAGDFYQVSNQLTLGTCEEETIDVINTAVAELVDMEHNARRSLYNNHRDELRCRLEHALGLLMTASTISSQEALSFLSQIRMGVEMNLMGEMTLETVNDLFLLTLPAHLQTMKGELLDSSDRNELRADYVKHRLKTT